MRWPSRYGTHSIGVDRATPDFRPSTVSIMLGRPAMRSSDHCPLVTRWRSLSSAVIWRRNRGNQDRPPSQIATGVSLLRHGERL